MVNVAVAGGTGGVGQTIVEVLGSSHHQAFVLSRKVPSRLLRSLPLPVPDTKNQSQPSKETQTITVDYSDICSLITVLEIHKIHTVISAFSVEGDSLAKSQKNLIEAAIRSKETKRFVPSGYAIPYPRTYDSLPA
jgi:aspartate-semialdehyde dehydrogenase